MTTRDSIADRDVVKTFRAELYAAFGAHFELWAKDDTWTRISAEESQHDDAGDDAPLERQFIAALDRAAAGNAPRAVQQTNGRWLLAIVFSDASADELVATATFSTDRPDLLERTARLAIDAFQQSRRLFQCSLQLDSYASNLTRNLEELAFLCSCTEHLDIGGSGPDVWQIAAAVLPRLRETVNASAVVLLPAGGLNEQPPAIWAGTCAADDAACWSLVRQFAADDDTQPVVRNYFADSQEMNVVRHIQSFVLTPVAKGGFSLGWLLALNRIKANGEDPTILQRAHAGLSDVEFGTVEAHLLQFTAALLAAQGRNAALLRGGAAR